MEELSDEEFYDAREEISSISGSDMSDDEASAEIGNQERSEPQEDSSSKPPWHNHLPSPWSVESRFSVWQDGPKTVRERRRLLYERFGVLSRMDGRGGEDGHELSSATDQDGGHDRVQIGVTRFGVGKYMASSRKGMGSISPVVDYWPSAELDVSDGNGLINLHNRISTTIGNGIELSRQRFDDSRGSGGTLGDVEHSTLVRSRSDSSVALINNVKIGNRAGMSGSRDQNPVRSASGSLGYRRVQGIERLTQSSGAVLMNGSQSSCGPAVGIRANTVPSESVPANLQNFALHSEKVSRNRPPPSLAVGGRQELHATPPNNQSTSVNPMHACAKIELDSDAASLLSSSHRGQLDLLKWQLSANALQTISSSRQSMLDRTPSRDENNDVAYTIKDLDSGKEFIIDDVQNDGIDPKLRDLGTGKELTLDEFETSLGLSPVMQELRRREREKGNLDDDEDATRTTESTSSGKKKSFWMRTVKGVAKTVGVSRTKPREHDPSTPDYEGRGSEEQDSRKSTAVRPKSLQRVKVQVYKKNYKDLSDLNIGQEIQAHQGAIWTMKFSLDGRYLASAGQDRVVYVREVLDHPLVNDQVAKDVVVEPSGGTPEQSQQLQQEGSQGLCGSLPGSLGKRKSKDSTLGKLSKHFWLSEKSVCSFKGHSEDVLDLSWSRSQFLLSSSMDKTVRLWHISYGECLRVFTHSDYVTCIEFSPTDDRYFLSGSLDDKVRIWSIPDHQVVDWSDVREMVTSASYSHDGKRAVIGTYRGTCRFYNTTGHSLQLDGQIDVRNSQSKKASGKKITGLQFMPGESSKVLITSNDSRIRIYDGLELSLKFKGFRNINSQISATFNRTGEYIISASEDSRVYIWNSGQQDFRGSQKDKSQSYEYFYSNNVSIAIPWPGLDQQPHGGVLKESQSGLDTSSSRQSGNDGLLRSPLQSSPCSCSSMTSNATTKSGSVLTAESVGEGKSDHSKKNSGRNGSVWEAGGEEVTSKRVDASISYMGHFIKPGTLFNSCFGESPCVDFVIPPFASSPALSTANGSPSVGRPALKSPRASFFTDMTPKGSATWPEEKLPRLLDSVRSQGASWSASSPSDEILSADLTSDGSTMSDMKTSPSWGQVIVTASLGGEIRTFQNYGYPIQL